MGARGEANSGERFGRDLRSQISDCRWATGVWHITCYALLAARTTSHRASVAPNKANLYDSGLKMRDWGENKANLRAWGRTSIALDCGDAVIDWTEPIVTPDRRQGPDPSRRGLKSCLRRNDIRGERNRFVSWASCGMLWGFGSVTNGRIECYGDCGR